MTPDNALPHESAAPAEAIFVGPTYPFKGGISQYATRFFAEFAKRRPARMVTYRGLYPKWLFPGNSEADPSEAREALPSVERRLSFLNPLTFLALGRSLSRAGKPVVLTWWTIAWLPHSWLLMSQIRDKSRLVLWCHNVIDHDCSPFKARLIRRVLAGATQFVAHTEPDAERLREWFPKASVLTSPLPLLPMPGSGPQVKAPPNPIPRLLFFGFVRPYKGLEDLLRALPDVLARRKVELTIAGEFWNDTERETESLIRTLGIGNAVSIENHYIPNEKLADVFRTHDLVVMPYRSATGSAVANMAIEYERPIIATDVGSLPSCVEEGVNGLLAPANDVEALSAAILKALDHPFDPAALRRHREDREHGWDDLIDAVEIILPRA